MNNIIEQQVTHLIRVKRAITDLPIHDSQDVDQILHSIKTIKEDIKTAKLDDLPGLFDLLHLNHSLLERLTKKNKLPDPSCPYFGHMRILENNKTRDYYLGHISFISAKDDIRIIDWREAPIAQVFFNYSEDDDFEFEVPGRIITGKLIEKNILSIRDGKLLRIDKSTHSYVYVDKKWDKIETKITSLEGGQGVATRDLNLGTGETGFVTPQISSLLDKEQFSILKKDDFRPLLLIGGAGCGKTTVAIHRLAFLVKNKGYDPRSILVIVPHKGLITLIKKMLIEINLERVRVISINDFMKMHARNLLVLPNEVSQETPYNIALFKKAPIVKSLINQFYQDKIDKVTSYLDKNSDLYHKIIILNSFKEIIDVLYTYRNSLEMNLRLLVEKEKELMFEFLEDRNSILANKPKILENFMSHKQNISLRMVEDVVGHTLKQIKNIDYDYYDALDVEKNILNQTNEVDLSLIDQEDYALFLYMLKVKCGELKTPRGELRKVQHLVLDETQELTKLELNILSTIINRECVTMAGDAAQQIDEMQNFTSWEQVLTDLSLNQVDSNELFVTYRSPKLIMDFAFEVLGDQFEKPVTRYTKIGKAVGFSVVQQRAHASMIISEALNKLLVSEPRASVAIITNTTQTAKDFYKELGDLGHVRLVLDGDFSFKPGVDITTVEMVKGLEFDYVIIPDADSINYPETNIARRRMHLASTRAVYQLWVLSSENRSKILDFIKV